MKRILNEDVNEVSPTLGFNIRTIIHKGYSLNVCALGPLTFLVSKMVGTELSDAMGLRGYRRPNFASTVLEELL